MTIIGKFLVFDSISILFMIAYSGFRIVPTFGLDTIWKFINNVSGLKQLAAWDFEDILQVCIYVAIKLTATHNWFYSVSSLSLKGSSQTSTNIMRKISSTPSSSLQLGMPMPSFASTQNIHLHHLSSWQDPWERKFVYLQAKSLRTLLSRSSQRKLLLKFSVLLQTLNRRQPRARSQRKQLQWRSPLKASNQ